MRTLPIGRGAGVPGPHDHRPGRWGARWQLYGVLAAMVVVMVVIAVAAFLVLGNLAGGFVLVMVIGGIRELFEHRAEVLETLSPAAREVSKLRR